MNNKTKVLLGSPIRQHPEILKSFLTAIKELYTVNLLVDYQFIDNNTEDESSNLLAGFAEENPTTTVNKFIDEDQYICNETTHLWNEQAIWKVAEFKNDIIRIALLGDYDFLFLVDSDLVLHPKTLTHLITHEKDIVAEIFWTKWEPDFPELPQVWVSDQYNLFESPRGENLTQEELFKKVASFIGMLRVPGIYKVGGLGACTLISKKALQAGVNYKEIYNVSLVGEDRHFCLRAAALGFELFADTHYPAFHIYRLSDLDNVEAFKKLSIG